MHRLLILIVMTLSFLCCLMAPAFAAMCPPVPVPPGGDCACSVQNYSTVDDTNVVVELFYFGGPTTFLKATVSAGLFTNALIHFDQANTCGCKVTGAGTNTRTSLQAIDSSGNLLAVVPCN